MRSKILMFGVFTLVLAQAAAYAGGACCAVKDGKHADKAASSDIPSEILEAEAGE